MLPGLTLIRNHGLSYLTCFLITYLNYSVMSQSLLEFNLFWHLPSAFLSVRDLCLMTCISQGHGLEKLGLIYYIPLFCEIRAIKVLEKEIALLLMLV